MPLLFDLSYDSECLGVTFEPTDIPHHLVKGFFPVVAERWVANVMKK